MKSKLKFRIVHFLIPSEYKYGFHRLAIARGNLKIAIDQMLRRQIIST